MLKYSKSTLICLHIGGRMRRGAGQADLGWLPGSTWKKGLLQLLDPSCDTAGRKCSPS